MKNTTKNITFICPHCHRQEDLIAKFPNKEIGEITYMEGNKAIIDFGIESRQIDLEKEVGIFYCWNCGQPCIDDLKNKHKTMTLNEQSTSLKRNHIIFEE